MSELQIQNLSLWWSVSKFELINKIFKMVHQFKIQMSTLALAYSLYFIHRYEWTPNTKLILGVISQKIWTDEPILQNGSSVQISCIIILPHLQWHTVYMSATEMSELQKQNLSLWWSVRKFDLMNEIFKLVYQFKFQVSSFCLICTGIQFVCQPQRWVNF